MAVIIQAVKGATLREPLSITGRDGTPTNLTGAVLTWMAKERIDDLDAAAKITATSASGSIVVDDAVNGAIHLNVPAATTNALDPAKRYVWTLQIVSGGVTTRYPDGFQRGPGILLVTPSAVTTVPV
jgi:hypothetical protein